MVDQLDSNTRSPNPDAEIDDPLAELARIIGYERPAETVKAESEEPGSNEFDLEAELMRELDVPQPADADHPERLADDVAEQEPAEIDEASPEEAEFVFSDSDSSEWDSMDSASIGSVSGQDEDEFSVDLSEDLDVEETADTESGPADVWETEDLDAGNGEAPWGIEGLDAGEDETPWEIESLDAGEDETSPDFAGSQQVPEPIEHRPAGMTRSDSVEGRAVPEIDAASDDVLADIVRFEIPSRDPRPSPSYTARETGAGHEPVSLNVTPVLQDEPGDARPSVAEQDEAALDFEEYLSTELDVFGQEVAMAEDGDQDRASASSSVPGIVAGSDLERALDALDVGDDIDDQSSIFDEAAEELLSDIARNEPAPEDDTGFTEARESWSVDSIEDGVAEELDEELEDMFDLPEPVQGRPVAEPDEPADEFELDLEQVLAETAVETADFAQMPAEAAGGLVAYDDAEPHEDAESEEWPPETGVEAPAERDEMAEAFLGLVPADSDDAPDVRPAAAPSPADTAHDAGEKQSDQADWLSGFEASRSAAASPGRDVAENDYFFDPELISEPEETVEAVAPIDVPELEHDEPQPLDPDYDLEIEREFSDIVDLHEPAPEGTAGSVIVGGFGSVESWSRSPATPQGYEASDDYIALERELGSDEDRLARSGGARVPADDDFHGAAGEAAPAAHQAGPGSRGPILALAVLGLAVLAGVGAFGWSMLSGDGATDDGGPRIIRADKDPVKVLPENPGGVTVPNQDKAVYDRVAGDGSSSAGQPALVNSAEEPIDVVQRTLDPEILPLEGRSDVSVKSEDRLAASGSEAATGTDAAGAPVISPRKVRTMVVKPDGSIVAREEPEPAVADTEIAAAEPQMEMTAEPVPAPAVDAVEPTQPQAPATEPGTVADAPATEGSIAPVRVVKTQQIRPVANAPVPQGRPADQPVNVVGTVTQAGTVAAAPAASQAPAAAPAAPAQPVEVASAATAPAAANPGGYYVQIASQPTEEGAQASWRTLSGRYSSVLGGLSVDIQRADIPGKGIFHRVRVPAGTRDQANALCSRYKAAGGSCFVSR